MRADPEDTFLARYVDFNRPTYDPSIAKHLDPHKPSAADQERSKDTQCRFCTIIE